MGIITSALFCMAMAVYFEARGESFNGQVAVAEVIINRVRSPLYPDTPCEVIAQGALSSKKTCQFSFMCDGVPDKITDDKAFDKALRAAYKAMATPGDPTQGAEHYHAKYVRPGWAKPNRQTVSIGEHLFYKLY